MKFIPTFIFYLIFTSTFGQSKQIVVETDTKGDTSLYFNFYHERIKKLNLSNLYVSNSDFHFRFWTVNQVIEIEKIGKTYKSKLTNWTKEYSSDESIKNPRLFIENIELQKEVIDSILFLIKEFKVLEIPLQKEIIGWQTGFDGMTYVFEFADLKQYIFKTYWSPHAQKEAKEAMLIQGFANRIQNLTLIKDNANSFQTRIPFECSYNDGISISCKILSKKERRKIERERRKYYKDLL